MAGHQLEAPLLRHGREQQDAFHPRESFADADAGASTEREIRKFRAIVGIEPAVGVEAVGLGEPARVAMHHPGTHH